MVTNGSNGKRTLSELLAEIERDKAADERADREALVEQLRLANEQLAKLTQPPPLLRSRMSAREKSDWIEARKAEGLSGEALQRAYFAIPWE